MTTHFRFDLPARVGSPFVSVAFTYKGVAQTLAAPVPAADPTKQAGREGSGFLRSFLPALLSLVCVVMGAGLLHSFTHARERAARMVQYHPVLRAFKKGWDRSHDPAVLEYHFRELERSMPIPEELFAAYRE